MNHIHRMIARLRERFTDWSPETVKVTPPPETEGPAKQRDPTEVREPKAKLPSLWRLAEITNPATGKVVVVEVRKDGLLFKGDTERLGITHVEQWHEVRATSRTEARKRIAEGAAEKAHGGDIMKPRLRLVGEDGNAFAILGRARQVARQAGWTDEEWQEFYREATSADYNHLLATVMEHFDCDGDEDE